MTKTISDTGWKRDRWDTKQVGGAVRNITTTAGNVQALRGYSDVPDRQQRPVAQAVSPETRSTGGSNQNTERKDKANRLFLDLVSDVERESGPIDDARKSKAQAQFFGQNFPDLVEQDSTYTPPGQTTRPETNGHGEWRQGSEPKKSFVEAPVSALPSGVGFVAKAARSIRDAKPVQVARDMLNRLRPEQRPWYNPTPAEIAARHQREARQARPVEGMSPLRMTNDVQLRPAGQAVSSLARNMLHRGQSFIDGFGEFFAQAQDQAPVRVQHALRVVEELRGKLEAGQELTPKEAALYEREIAILKRHGDR
ncbi:hypothetical protein SAMN06295888_14515 [Desulfonatronum zhilinae]|nr:hypothetical protein SAMN06295888_14515 [Desulfonatronum zhilinae]